MIYKGISKGDYMISTKGRRRLKLTAWKEARMSVSVKRGSPLVTLWRRMSYISWDSSRGWPICTRDHLRIYFRIQPSIWRCNTFFWRTGKYVSVRVSKESQEMAGHLRNIYFASGTGDLSFSETLKVTLGEEVALVLTLTLQWPMRLLCVN